MSRLAVAGAAGADNRARRPGAGQREPATHSGLTSRWGPSGRDVMTLVDERLEQLPDGEVIG